MSTLTKMLTEFEFPRTPRKNVLRPGQKDYEGFVLGKVNARQFGQVISNKTKLPKYKNLFLESKKLMKRINPNFKFTSIQYNKNQRAAKHKDANNIGPSYIIGLGNYTGGEIIVYDENGNNPKKINIKNKAFKFNGSKLYHETAPFKGQRFTLVFYHI